MEEEEIEKEAEIKYGGANYAKRSVIRFLRYVFERSSFVTKYKWSSSKEKRKIDIVSFYPFRPSAIPQIIVRAAPQRVECQWLGGLGMHDVPSEDLTYSGRMRYSITIEVRSFAVDEAEYICDILCCLFVDKRLEMAFVKKHYLYIDPMSIRFTGIREIIIPGTDRVMFIGTVTLDTALEFTDKLLGPDAEKIAGEYVSFERYDPKI